MVKAQPYLPGAQKVAGGGGDEKQLSATTSRRSVNDRVPTRTSSLLSRGREKPGLHGSPLPGRGSKTSVT